MAIITSEKLERISQLLTPWLQQRLGSALVDLPPARKPTEGGSSETVYLSPVIEESGVRRQHQWVLRIEATSHQIYEEASVARQFGVMEELARDEAVPVPKVLWYEPDAEILGAPFFLMERIAGEVPAGLYHSEGLLVDASPDERHRMWCSAVAALAAVHRADPARLDFLAYPGSHASGLEQELARWDSYSRWCGVTLHPIQQQARAWLAAQMPDHRPTGLAWGDARLSNMVFHKGVCRAVIDWETASLGGAETDLVWWLFYDWYISDGIGVPRLPGLGNRDELVSTWEEHSGRKAEALEWHEVFATWRYSMIRKRAQLLRGDVEALRNVALEDNPVLKRLGVLLES